MKLKRINSGVASRWMQTDRIHCGITGNGPVVMISNIWTASIVMVEARETVAL